MTIYLRGKTLWVEFQFKGQTIRQSAKTTSRAKAREFEKKLRDELHAQAVLGRVREMTFGEAVDLYETTVLNQKRKAADGNPRRATLDDGLKLGKLEKHFGPEKPLSDVASPAALSEFHRVMLKGRRANSVNRYLSLLRAVLNRAYEAGGLIKRPEIKALKVNDRREVYLTEDQERAVIAACPPHLANLVTFLLDTGARLSEATNLTWAMVELEREGRPLVVFPAVNAKNDKPRTVPLPKRTAEMLRALKAVAPEDQPRVFLYRPGEKVAKKGKGRRPAQLKPQPLVPFTRPKSAWETVRKAAKVPEARLHDLRHTYAAKLVKRGVPLLEVSKLLGHSSIQMTMRYAHLAPDQLESAVAKLD
jgi:integrase